jgi:hypothetical protein
MLNSVEGIYRDGKVLLTESVPSDAEGRVIVTFLSGAEHVDLDAQGIDSEQAADLRRRLGAFADDWQQAEMDVYDAI